MNVGVGSRQDRTWLVVLAASMWGWSALLREPLSRELPSATIVLFEHLTLVVLVSPWLVPALRALRRVRVRSLLSVLVIGGGSSALATTMFTKAFTLGDPVTPQVLQKLQPLIALLLAAVLLGERVTPRFASFAVPALAGAWLLSFPEPFDVSVQGLQAAALAVGAATLWGAGTVLGRLASAELSFTHLTTLRFTVGLAAMVTICGVSGTRMTMPVDLFPRLFLLALFPGFVALMLYYIALRSTPASRATLAELAFPFTAAVVGVTLLDARLDASQWFGAAIVVTAVVTLALHEQRSRRPAVATPDDAEVALHRAGVA